MTFHFLFSFFFWCTKLTYTSLFWYTKMAYISFLWHQRGCRGVSCIRSICRLRIYVITTFAPSRRWRQRGYYPNQDNGRMTSLDDGALSTNAQIWSNENRIQSTPRALPTSSDVPFLSCCYLRLMRLMNRHIILCKFPLPTPRVRILFFVGLTPTWRLIS